MTHRTPQLPDQLLLFDALAGEFYPIGDQHGRAQTLGRLGMVTLNRGEPAELPESHDADELFGMAYTPSWAPEVRAVALARQTLGTARLVGLTLHRGDAEKLVVEEFQAYEGFPAQVLLRRYETGVPRYVADLPLALGAGLQHTRQAVTEHAQEFFSRT